MALSPSTLLDQVESAITALLTSGASSYSIGARSVTKHDIGELFEWRRQLLQEVAASTGGGVFRLAKFSKTSE